MNGVSETSQHGRKNMNSVDVLRVAKRIAATGGAVALIIAADISATVAESFVVGAVGSLTGGAAAFDKPVVEGVEAAIRYWNDQGGFQGRKIELRLLDDESQPASAVTVYRRLTDDLDVRAVVGASPSPSLVAIKAVADEFKTPTTGTATLNALADPPAKYFFRALPSADAYMQALMNWVKARGYRSIASLNPSDVTGQREAMVIKQLASQLGITLTAAESYTNTDTNFTAQLVNIRNSNPDFLYAGAIGGPTVLVFKQIKQLNLKMPIGIHSSAFNQAFYTGIGGKEQAEGVYSPMERGGIGAAATGIAGELFKAASNYIGHPATNLNTAGFDTALIIMNAANKTNGTRDGIRDAIEALSDVQVIGGLVSYSPTNHHGKDERSIAIVQMVNGQLTEVK
jgi:branched-chain amino acid transport system substrate-binding protein